MVRSFRRAAGGNTRVSCLCIFLVLSLAPITQGLDGPTSNPTQSKNPSDLPSLMPSVAPTAPHTMNPPQFSSTSAYFSDAPSYIPSVAPSTPLQASDFPRSISSVAPSSHPSHQTTDASSISVTQSPLLSAVPTSLRSYIPSLYPTIAESLNPSGAPTSIPSTVPTLLPSSSPSLYPTIAESQNPSGAPTPIPSTVPTSLPSNFPSLHPTIAESQNPSGGPTPAPSVVPTFLPSYFPSLRPTIAESQNPTKAPTSTPSQNPSAWPTSVPSTVPSSPPSSGPTRTPKPTISHEPTGVPSAAPTSLPSQTPSLSPSSSPSSRPSDAPSDLPSSHPSVSRAPSVSPSTVPSVSPSISAAPSTAPSFVPSNLPTISVYPSQAPSAGPSASLVPSSSSHPTSKPSFLPTDEPSISPSQSLPPSDLPSDRPSLVPSRAPTGVPSPAPSSPPTEPPSPTPSLFPSADPSDMPSVSPSMPPSEQPSWSPSAEPSRLPSSSPTLQCHDHIRYRSPINNLTCSDHAGTNCVYWRALGLNTTELAELVNNCPESCEIPCGSFLQFQISVSYRLSNVPGLLDTESTRRLEEMSFDFLTVFFHTTNPDVNFELDEVEMAFQTEIVPEVPQQRRKLLLAEQSISISVVFRGFTIGMTSDSVTQKLVLGIDDPEFTLLLRRSGVSYFAMAEASSATEVDRSAYATRIDNGKERGTSTATVVVSTLVSISIVMFGVGAIFYHRRSGKWVPVPWDKPLKQVEGRDLSSPKSWGRSSNPGSPIPFTESPTATTSNVQGGLLGLIASMSLSRSRSSTSAEDVSSSDTSGDATVVPTNGPLVSPMSEDSAPSLPTAHPLARAIPPMIVIENIDEANDMPNSRGSDQQEQQTGRDMILSRRVEASSAFLAALSECRKPHPHTANTVAGMLYHNESFGDEMDLNVWSNIEESPRNLSPLGIIMDSDTDDGTSVASTPVHATPRQSMPLRRSASTNALDVSSSNRAEDFDKTRPPESLLSPESPNKAGGGSSSFSFKCEAIDDDEEGSLDLELGPSPPPSVGSSQINPRSFSDVHFRPVPDHRSETESSHLSRRASSSPYNGGRPSRWSLSPISKVKSMTPRSSTNRPFLQKRTDSFYKRKVVLDASSTSVHSDDDHRLNGPNNKLSDSTPKNGDVRLEFEAPRKGQLGLVIEARPQVGPTVHAIKDYSPLFGRVKMGDKIVEVDGKNTTHSNLTEITKLLAVRPGRRGSNLRIVVARPHHAQPVQPIPLKKVSLPRHHARNSSYGSGISIPENQEALDVEAASVPQQTADDLLRHSHQANKVDFKREDLVRNLPYPDRNFPQADKGDFKRDDLPRNSHRPVRNSHQADSVEFKRDDVLRKPHHARNSHQADMSDFKRDDFLRNLHTPERNSAQADSKRDDLSRNTFQADEGDFEGEL